MMTVTNRSTATITNKNIVCARSVSMSGLQTSPYRV